MKILLINNLYGPYARGGAERVVERIAQELLRPKHEVAVVSSRPLQFSIFNSPARGWSALGGQFSIKIQIPNTKYQILYFYPWNLISYYNLHKLPKLLRPLWHLINIFNIQSYFKIKNILKQEKPDIVMTHNLMGVGFLTPLAVEKLNIKHIHTLHDIQLLHPSGLMMVGEEKKVDGLFARLYQWLTKKLFASVDVVVSPSQWLLDEHVKRGFFAKAKKEVMANPALTVIASEAPLSGAKRSNPLKVEGIASSLPAVAPRNDTFVFLYVGQIEKHKGVELLIAAFTDLQNKNCELWIVGDGNQKSEIIPQYCGKKSENIKFFGKKTSEEVRGLMQKAHCLVVPSLCYENQPTVIREAQQNDLPVIASNIGGITEMLDRQCLFKAGDRESLISKMGWVVNNKNTLQEITQDKSGKLKHISVADYVDRLLKL